MIRLLLATAVLAAAAPAFAGEKTEVGGKLTINANAKNITSAAIGNRVSSHASQATIYEGTTIKGDTTINANAKNITSAAIGNRAQSTAHQASVGAPK